MIDVHYASLTSLKWVKSPPRFLEICLSYEKTGNNVHNFGRKMLKLQLKLDLWRTRDLTIFGRVLIIKSLGISQLVYSISNVEVPDYIVSTKRIQRKRFTIRDIEHSDHLVKLYTGLQNAEVFKLLADKLRDKAARLHYARGSASITPKYHQQAENREKPGPERKTSVEEEFFMTLVPLRQSLTKEDLAFRMKVSQSTVNRIVPTWIAFLSRELAPLIYWPTGEEVKLYYPECFKTFPNVKAIIDYTEVYIQRPSLAEAQALTYSTYKSTNTWKTLVWHSW